MLVRMELWRIITSEITDQQMIYLREVGGERSFPILIGLFEASSIDRRVKNNLPVRPLTHELMKALIAALDGEADSVVITSLTEHTYYAEVRVRKGEELVAVDARPSDAIALAVHYHPPLPIYVSDEVLAEVC